VASFTINGQAWPSGTTVSVYPAAAQPAGSDGPPAGTAVTSAVQSGASVTFTGLLENVRYVAYAGGVARRFLVPQQDPMDARSLRARVDELTGDTLPGIAASIEYSLVTAGVTIYATSAAAFAGADQSALIQAAADLCETNGWKLVSGRGGHVKITNTVRFGDISFDLSDLQVNVDFPYPLAVETPAIQVYHPDVVFVNRVSARGLGLPEVVNADRGGNNPRWFIDTTISADPAAGTTLALSAWPAGWPSAGNFQVRLQSAKAVTAAASTDLIALTAHGFSADQLVNFTAMTGGAGITSGGPYYVLASGLTANAFKVGLTPGGAIVDITSDMTLGTVNYQEVVLVTAGHGTTSLTITRAQDDTKSAPHPIGAQAATSVSQNDIGVQLVNCEGCMVNVPRIVDFSVGLDEVGYGAVTSGSPGIGAGHVYNTVRIGFLSMNRVNHRQGQLDSLGWCNSNTYLSGSYGHFDYAQVGLRLPGVKHVEQRLIDNFAYHLNDNKWFGAGFENRLAQYEIETGGSNNSWIRCRWEKSQSSPRIHYLDGAVLNVTDNTIEGGYGSDQIVPKYDNLTDSPRNVIVATAGRRNNEIVITPTDTTDYALRVKRAGDGLGGARLLVSKNGELYWSSAGTGVYDAALRGYGARQLLMDSPEGQSFTLEVRRSEPSGTPQAADLQKWATTADATLAAITKSGALKLVEQTSVDAAGAGASEAHFYVSLLGSKRILTRRDPSRVELIPGTLQNTATWDPGSLVNGAEERKSVTVTGAAVGDAARAGLTTIAATGWKIWATVIAADTVEVTIRNDTGGTVDLGSGTVRAIVDKYT
jgi:hypothetical protein